MIDLGAGGDFNICLHAARLVDRAGRRAFAAIIRFLRKTMQTCRITICSRSVALTVIGTWKQPPI
jgi:hypothetical protein